jgi:hypothetical protein
MEASFQSDALWEVNAGFIRAEFFKEASGLRVIRFTTLLLQHCKSHYTQSTYYTQQGSNLQPCDPRSRA